MEPINVGVIGAGGISRIHLHTLSTLPGVRLLAIADVALEKAQERAQQFNIPHVFGDHRELLAMDEIAAVHVCTFNQAHRAPTVDALHAGKHVMVEKPMAATLADATAMVRAAKETGKLLNCALKTRYSDDIMAAKRIIESGELGEIYYAETVADRRRGIPGGSFVRQESAGIGATADIGVYALDTALHLMGHPTPVSVSGIITDVIGKTHEPPLTPGWRWKAEDLTVEELGIAWVRFANGAVLVFKTTWAMHMDTLGGAFFLGPKAGLRLTPEFKVFRDQWGCLVDIAPQAKPTPDVELFRREIEDFYNAIREGRPAPINPMGVLLTNVIIDGVIASAKAGGAETPVTVPAF
ncbi:MAG: Gfo/Idh/MocA family oxidoreductase [Caldilineaceae bacterium]|nr:Gfo/Idh/MocA family oxidoreductase [Caldilineaceae bacterium]